MVVPALIVFLCVVQPRGARIDFEVAPFPGPGERLVTPCPVRMHRAQRGDTLGGRRRRLLLRGN